MHENCDRLLALRPPKPRPVVGTLCYGPGEAIGWAALAGRGDVVSALADRFADDPGAVVPNSAGGAGTVAFALHVTGGDGRSTAERTTNDPHSWAGAGDVALAEWVLASTAPDVATALEHLSNLLGFTLEPGHVYADHNAVSLSEIAGGFTAVPTGPLRHGSLPRLEARAWLDVAHCLGTIGHDQYHVAVTIAQNAHARQDDPARGHLWNPTTYHRLTNAIRVDDDEVAAL